MFLRKTLHTAEQNRPDVAKARIEWRHIQPTLNPGKLIFNDETSTKSLLLTHFPQPMSPELVVLLKHRRQPV
jgi:hypothetical protein